MWFRNHERGTISKPFLAVLCVATVAFPPNLFANAIIFTYNGGGTAVSPRSYSDPAAWTCAPSCVSNSFPDNTVAGGSVAAIINSGQPDYVLLDTPGVITGLRLTSLTVGGSGLSSTLSATNGSSLTLGTADSPQYALVIGNGGILNIGESSSVALDMSSGTSASIDGGGAINLTNGSSLTLPSQLTNHGEVDVFGSILESQGFDSYADEFSGGSCGCDGFPQSGNAALELEQGSAQINGDLTNQAEMTTSDGFGEPAVEIGLDYGSNLHVIGNAVNSASSAAPLLGGGSAWIWLNNQSSVTVDGNYTNDSHGMSVVQEPAYVYSAAELDLNSSTMTVAGQFSNLGGSAVYMDAYDGSGSMLIANGGLVNNNSYVFLSNASVLNIHQASLAAAQPSGLTWAFRNTSDDGTNIFGQNFNEAVLQVGFPQLGPSNSAGENAPLGSVVNIKGGLLNQATSTKGGWATSVVNVDSGSTLNADRVLNLAKTNDGGGSPQAEINVLNGSTMNVTTLDHTGVLTNSAVAAAGSAYADVDVAGRSTLTADSVVNSFVSSNNGAGAATITVDGSTMTVNQTFNNTGGVLNLINQAQVTVRGQFTNDAAGVVNLDGNVGFPTPQAADALSGSVLNTNGFSNSGQVSLNQQSAINNTGAFQNSGSVTIDNHSALKVTPHDGAADGSLTNTGSITTGENGGGGNVILVQGDMFNTAPGVVNIHGEDDAMTVIGQFNNSGDVSVGGGSTIQATAYVQSGGHTAIENGGTLEADVTLSGGGFSGDGTIVGDVKVNGGTLAPGDPQSIDVIGNYEQTLLGILDLDFAGGGEGEYDQIHVRSDDQHPDGGNVLLGGTLQLTLEDSFGAGIDIGTLFHILTWTGDRLNNSDFNSFQNRTFSNGTKLLTFQKVFRDGGLDLAVVEAGVTATPEPSTVSMFFGVMLLAGGAVWMRRRRNGTG